MQEGSTEEEEMKQQQRMTVMKDMTRNIRAEETTVDGSVNYWLPSAKRRGPCWMGRYYAEVVRVVVRNEEEG